MDIAECGILFFNGGGSTIWLPASGFRNSGISNQMNEINIWKLLSAEYYFSMVVGQLFVFRLPEFRNCSDVKYN